MFKQHSLEFKWYSHHPFKPGIYQVLNDEYTALLWCNWTGTYWSRTHKNHAVFMRVGWTEQASFIQKHHWKFP